MNVCAIEECGRLARTLTGIALCPAHYEQKMRRRLVIVCPECGVPMREPAARCGFCEIETRVTA